MLIWVIETGLPGATNQCVGVARAIATLGPCRIERVNVRLRSHLLQPVFRTALRRSLLDRWPERRRARWLAGLMFSGVPATTASPDITVSALGRGEIAAALLRAAVGSAAIHIGRPSRMPSHAFDFIVLPPGESGEGRRCASVSLDVLPTPVLLADVSARTGPPVSGWRSRQPRLWAVLIGGDGAGLSYDRRDWERLPDSLQALAGRHGAGLLVATSRRTGAAAEAVIKAGLNQSGRLIDAAWYSKNPAAVVADHLAAAEAVFCTEDSFSIISDAIAAGKPVYVLRPEAGAAEDRLATFLAMQEEKRRIRRVRIGQLAGIDLDADIAGYFRPRTECWSVALLDSLTAALPWLHASEPPIRPRCVSRKPDDSFRP